MILVLQVRSFGMQRPIRNVPHEPEYIYEANDLHAKTSAISKRF
jgi:hypothetical protein